MQINFYLSGRKTELLCPHLGQNKKQWIPTTGSIVNFCFSLLTLLFLSTGVNAQSNDWNIQFNQSFLNCLSNQVCYDVELQSASPSDWALADQNYRFFFDGDLMTVTSVTSLLPPEFYSEADIDQNMKISGQGQESASPLDDIDGNLGFLDFTIIETDKSNPQAATQLLTGFYTPTVKICFDIAAAAITDNNCLSIYHSRPATAGGITNQYTVFSENDAPGSTIATGSIFYDDLTTSSGEEACLYLSCDTCASANGDTDSDGVCDDDDCAPNNPNLPATPGTSCDDNNSSTISDIILADGCTCAGTIMDKWNIRLLQSGVNCQEERACYVLQIQNESDTPWALGDQNYRLFFDGDLMTVTSVTSLLPSNLYFPAIIDMNLKYQGQEANSPLDNIDSNLGFLDFNIVEIEKSNPNTAVQLNATAFISIAQICVDVAPAVMEDTDGETCLSFIHSRPSTAGAFTNQYTVITENDAPNSTEMTMGISYDNLESSDGSVSCLGLICAPCGDAGGDTDNDGICDDNDCHPNNPNLPTTAGTACNDNNAASSNDVILADGCTCQGTVVMDCPIINANIGDACDDNNASTVNDTVQGDCSCAGTTTNIPDCINISITTSIGAINVSGINGAPITSVQVFNLNWVSEFTCFDDCTSPSQIIPVSEGTYHVYVKYYDANYVFICQKDQDVFITAASAPCDNAGGDSDNDGVCDDDDCKPYDANIPAPEGTTCNDDDANTTDDVIQADGCTCSGTIIPPNGDCANITINGTDAGITVGGLDGAPVVSLQIFNDANWSTEFYCFEDCDSPIQNVSLASGTYHVYVKYYNEIYKLICEVTETVTLGSGNCDNVTSGGQIGGTQILCSGEIAGTLTNVSTPSGGSGNIEYLWLSSTTSCLAALSQAIAGSTGATYEPGILTQTTFFRRCARRAGCDGYAGETNCIKVTVDNSTNCGNTGNDDIDLELEIIGDGAVVNPYQNFTITVEVSNTGTATANNVIVNIPQPENVVFQGNNTYTASQGAYDFWSTFNWNVGTLTPGQIETLTVNLYSLQGTNYTVYGQVQAATPADVDSVPGNGTAPIVDEDDEAVYVTGGGNTGGGDPSCPLTLTGNTSNILCNDNGTTSDADDDTFTFDLTISGGNPWGWTNGSDNGAYDISSNLGPFLINEGNVNFTVIDNNNNTCSLNISVLAPATCSSDDTDTNCENINISNTDDAITISGLDNAPLTATWIFDSNWNTVLGCSYTCNSTEILSVIPGTYHVIVKEMTADWEVLCKVEKLIVIQQLISNPEAERLTNEANDAELRSNTTENTKIGFNVYPNPATDYLTIELKLLNSLIINDDANKATVSLSNSFGREIFRKQVRASDLLDYHMNVSGVASGVYFLSIHSGNDISATQRVVLVR
jgi:hypothetical protein